MIVAAWIIGIALIAVVLWDAFETIVLPRRVTRRWRLTRMFYRSTWRPWRRLSHSMRPKVRERFLSFYGPLSLLALLAVWALTLVFAFAFLDFAANSVLPAAQSGSFWASLYLSGTTLFTLGIGDIVPHTTVGRFLTVFEAGTGLGFLALVMGYFPVLYQSFSRREVQISLLDARAGSPPSASEMLRRHTYDHGHEALRDLLKDWERWSAELMESHLSYPVLCYFRSQHDNESWLSALACILDVSAAVIVGIDGACRKQAELTFAIARHALVDLSQVMANPPTPPKEDRLPPEQLKRLRSMLGSKGMRLHDGAEADRKLTELRAMYEPYLNSLGTYLYMSTPEWVREERLDNWQTSAWGRISGALAVEAEQVRHDDHY